MLTSGLPNGCRGSAPVDMRLPVVLLAIPSLQESVGQLIRPGSYIAREALTPRKQRPSVRGG
jgi:hypothetical protein